MLFWQTIKKSLSLFIPEHINDPFGLTARLWASEHRSARFTLVLTALGIVLSPIDWIVSIVERASRHIKNDHLKNSSSQNHHLQATGPHIFVCGPARSGTTLVYQVLADQLDVAYTCNASTLFPRSRKLGFRLCQLLEKRHKPALTDHRLPDSETHYQNYYGKTSGFSEPSEANAFWNQWVEPDAADYRTVVTQNGMQQAADYFMLLANAKGLPTLAKNNNANVFANDLLAQLPNSYFICLRRDRKYLAQSLIRARIEINGDIQHSYGVIDTDGKAEYAKEAKTSTPYADVLDQIEYLDAQADRQQQHIGPDKFWIIDYETFCDNPSGLINRVLTEILGESPSSQTLAPITTSNKVSNTKIFERVLNEINRRSASAEGDKPNQSARTETRVPDAQ